MQTTSQRRIELRNHASTRKIGKLLVVSRTACGEDPLYRDVRSKKDTVRTRLDNSATRRFSYLGIEVKVRDFMAIEVRLGHGVDCDITAFNAAMMGTRPP